MRSEDVIGVVAASIIGAAFLGLLVWFFFLRAPPPGKVDVVRNYGVPHSTDHVALNVDPPLADAAATPAADVPLNQRSPGSDNMSVHSCQPEEAPMPPAPVAPSEPLAEASPPPPQGMSEDEAARKIQRLVKKFLIRILFLSRVQLWKEQEMMRKDILRDGRSGSVGCTINAGMEVTGVTPGGAAEAAGISVGDLIVLVTTTGRGGNRVFTPTPDRFHFLQAVGPQNEVFEGTSIQLTAIRERPAQEEFLSKSVASPGRGDERARRVWLDAVQESETEVFDVTVLPETDGARRTRIKKLETLKARKEIDAMDVQLVNSFMSDPEACRDFTRRIYEEADKDDSGVLSLDELKNVFCHMAEYTGCPHPTDHDLKKLFYVMDQSSDGEVSFDEMFPYFRSFQIRQIAELLESD